MKTSIFRITLCVLVMPLATAKAAAPDRCESKLEHYQSVRELSETEYRHITRKAGSQVLQGRFFEAQKNNRIGRQVLWLIPFADSEACVIRESVSLKKSVGV